MLPAKGVDHTLALKGEELSAFVTLNIDSLKEISLKLTSVFSSSVFALLATFALVFC